MKNTLTFFVVLASLFGAREALACGCFAPPNGTVPVVQAGERILFAIDQGQVTAHVQVQYSGADGAEFGWLLPLPSVPTLELGSDEVFAQLTTTTQPRYTLTTTFDSNCRPQPLYSGAGGAGGSSGGFGSADSGSVAPVLVVQASVGPYDYAVLHADSQDAMLEWLTTNHYLVPSGTTSAIAPYIQPGAYFLALKLRPGNDVGDLQPVVLHYAGDLGVIPLTLTSTGARRDMPVQVWMLGEGRAIPRNYAHAVINDALLDWQGGARNYSAVLTRAVGEAPSKHAFVTEFSGPAAFMKSTLAPANRFGTKLELASQPTSKQFVQYLYAHGFTAPSLLNPYGPQLLPSTLINILKRFIPAPAGTPAEFYYQQLQYGPETEPAPAFNAEVMASEIWERVVKPVQLAAELFSQFSTLTRLATTLSPEDMTRDPAFSFNRSLPPVSNLHAAAMHVSCNGLTGAESSAALITEQGWLISYPDGRFGRSGFDLTVLPAALRIEALRDEGKPDVLTDNTPMTTTMLTPEPKRSVGCQSIPVSAMGLVLVTLLRRRRSARLSPVA